MAGTEAAPKLLPHQKDEHDIWICKHCGWKYPNAKPSPKVRKHHKKSCGKGGRVEPGGSSDEASDDEHHSSVKGSVAVESDSRDFDFSGATKVEGSPEETLPDATVNGDAKASVVELSQPIVVKQEEHPKMEPKEAQEVPAVGGGGLMPHQKDEHDLWICKKCGWKYPNAKPSAKIRKNHKKHCQGEGGAASGAATGGSSDEASDDEHHSLHREGGAPKEATPIGSLPTEPSIAATESTDRSFDFAAVKDSAEVGNPGTNGTAELTTETSGSAIVEKSDDKAEPKVEPKEANDVAALAAGGLMAHQKDEHDIWICKDCGWKYPNAKPSAKTRKHHKKQCSGKGGPQAAAASGGSSDEASDDDHHHPLPAASAATGSGVENLVATEVPQSTPREFEFKALHDSSGTELKDEGTPAEISKTSLETEVQGLRGTPESTSTEAVEGHKVVPDVAEENKESVEPSASTATPELVELGGLLPHQKDENDIWICKDCGWKYLNSKPSAKIRKNHKKKCSGKRTGEAAQAGGSSDEASDDEETHPSVSLEAETSPAVQSKEFIAPASDGPRVTSVDKGVEAVIPHTNVEVEERNLETAAKSLSSEVGEVITPKESVEESAKPQSTGDTSAGSLSLKEALEKETQGEKEPAKVISLQEAMEKEALLEKELLTQSELKETPVVPEEEVADLTTPVVTQTEGTGQSASLDSSAQTSNSVTGPETGSGKEDATKSSQQKVVSSEEAGGLMPHQKDEKDIWLCSECGWRYPNARPSAKVRKHHKKNCLGKGGSVKNAGSTEDASSEDEKAKVGKCFPCL